MMFQLIEFEIALYKGTSHFCAMIIKPCCAVFHYVSTTISAGIVQELQGHALYISSEGC